MTIILHVANNPLDFAYLYDLKDFVSEKLKQAQAYANKRGMDYRDANPEAAKRALEREMAVKLTEVPA